MSSPRARSLTARLNAHFAASAALAVASVPEANAALVYSGLININIPSNTAGVYLNVVTGVAGSSPAAVPGWDLNPWSPTTLSYFSPAFPAGGVYVIGGGATGAAPANLPFGYVVSSASPFGSGNAATTGPLPHFLNSSENYIGFRFQNEANGNAIHYGWMRVQLSGSLGSQPRAIIEYVYEDQAGIPIPVAYLTPPCYGAYANCDGSTLVPILNINDFQCFLNLYAAGSTSANCDGSTIVPVLNVNDFQCFLNKFAAGCP